MWSLRELFMRIREHKYGWLIELCVAIAGAVMVFAGMSGDLPLFVASIETFLGGVLLGQGFTMLIIIAYDKWYDRNRYK